MTEDYKKSLFRQLLGKYLESRYFKDNVVAQYPTQKRLEMALADVGELSKAAGGESAGTCVYLEGLIQGMEIVVRSLDTLRERGTQFLSEIEKYLGGLTDGITFYPELQEVSKVTARGSGAEKVIHIPRGGHLKKIETSKVRHGDIVALGIPAGSVYTLTRRLKIQKEGTRKAGVFYFPTPEQYEALRRYGEERLGRLKEKAKSRKRRG